MSGLVNIKVEGLAELEAQLVDLGAELGVKANAVAARKSFQMVLENARNLVPVDTGELRESIKLTVVKPSNGDAVVAVGLVIGKAALGKAGTPGRAWQAEGARHFPARRRWHFIELGTIHMPAHSFLRAALDANASAVLETLKIELSKSIKRAVAKKGRG